MSKGLKKEAKKGSTELAQVRIVVALCSKRK